jgi:hypothetical protein
MTGYRNLDNRSATQSKPERAWKKPPAKLPPTLLLRKKCHPKMQKARTGPQQEIFLTKNLSAGEQESWLEESALFIDKP